MRKKSLAVMPSLSWDFMDCRKVLKVDSLVNSYTFGCSITVSQSLSRSSSSSCLEKVVSWPYPGEEIMIIDEKMIDIRLSFMWFSCGGVAAV